VFIAAKAFIALIAVFTGAMEGTTIEAMSIGVTLNVPIGVLTVIAGAVNPKADIAGAATSGSAVLMLNPPLWKCLTGRAASPWFIAELS